MPHDPEAAAAWVRLYDEPGEPADVMQAVGSYGAALDRFSTMAIQTVVSTDGDADDELVGLLMHPELEGVALSVMQNTVAERMTVEQLTAKLRELGWRWATAEEMRGLHSGYTVPGLTGTGRAVNGRARTAALRDLT